MELLFNTQELIDSINIFLTNLCWNYNIPSWILTVVIMAVVAGIVAGFVAVNTMMLVLAERKIAAHMQDRLGPMRVGFHGILQTVADAIKLVLKENIMPKVADKTMFFLAPIIVFAPAMMAYVILPWSPGIIVSDLNLGVLYLLAVGSIGVIGIIMAGWSSGNKYSLLGGMRSAAQVVSYEVSMVLSILGVIMLTGSLKMGELVNAQKDIWYICYQPLGFLLYLMAATAECNRAPFDMPEAESELVAGFHTEYGGIKFAMFFLAEYANIFAVSAVCTTLFLGGWQGIPGLPITLPPIVWFLIKTYAIVFIFMWFRWTYPRVRVDQLMTFGWKLLVPLGFINILITGLVMVIK
ncbi:MAG: NADH-quinone oxidoreductase subunit NuoH [bacterium]|nr:NADH-quinone oxidoreductase subunit NuoH [bacterium]